MAQDFREKFDIDFDILLDPSNPKFNEKYTLEDEAKENMATAIKINASQR